VGTRRRIRLRENRGKDRLGKRDTGPRKGDDPAKETGREKEGKKGQGGGWGGMSSRKIVQPRQKGKKRKPRKKKRVRSPIIRVF